MYEILVFPFGSRHPVSRVVVPTASDVPRAIDKAILAQPGCHQAEVHSAGRRLYSVACAELKTAS